MKNTEISVRKNKALSASVGMMTQVYVQSAKNAEIWDVEGNRYIDFAGGIAVVNTGHCNTQVIDAVKQQLDNFTHTCHQVVPYENYVQLAERLNASVPGNFEKKTMFATTGAEAVENAIKIARCATGRNGVIAFSGGFHGRTFMGMSLTGKVVPYKKDFGAMMPHIYHVPYPVALRGVTTEDSINAIEQLFKTTIGASQVAAILFEPIQGEGGFYQAPADFVRAIRKLCNTHGIVMIADEIQTGFARTGTLFAMEQYPVQADLTTMAKGLSGGIPLSAVTGRAELMDAPSTGGLGGTFGGNPLGIAAAHAVLDIIENDNLCERATTFGNVLLQRLQSVQSRVPHIAEVRGAGMMVAVEFNDPTTNVPDADFANRIRMEALHRNLILLTCGTYGNVIRFLAPLTIEQSVFDEALDILETCLVTLSK